MVVAARLGLILTFVCFASFGFAAKSVTANRGAVVLLVLAFGLVLRGIRVAMSAEEAWLSVSFAGGLVTGAIPAVSAVLTRAGCTPAHSGIMVVLWAVGLALACAASAATVIRFRPKLVLRRTTAARVLWFSVGPLMVFATWLVLTNDPCWLSDKPAVLVLPALTNALLGLFFGWYLAERDPETF